MSKKGWKAGAVLAAGAGITAVLAARKRGNRNAEKTDRSFAGSRSDYRNTELGKHDKNSKGIYYTNGNYEAFARPEKPAGIEEKSAWEAVLRPWRRPAFLSAMRRCRERTSTF